MSDAGAPSDEELLARCAAGDPDAFGDVFERHADAVLTHCVRRTGSRADAEDVASAVFLEAWRCRSRVHFVGGSALPWLYVVSNNVTGKAARARHRRVARERRAGRDEIEPDHAEETADRLDLHARAAVLARCLDELSPRHREVVALCDLGGLSIAHAAAALGIADGTVRSRLSRAHRHLRDLMAGQPEVAVRVTGSPPPTDRPRR